MAKLSRLAGSTSHIWTLFILDSSKSDGSGLTGLTNATSGLTCYYKRNTGAASVAVTLDTVATLGTYGTYAAGHGGFKEIDQANLPGFYEFQPPDAATAAGAKSVAFLLRGAANMVPCPVEVELTAVDNQDAQRFGLAALPSSGTLAVKPAATLAASDVSGKIPATVATGDGADSAAVLAAMARSQATATIQAVGTSGNGANQATTLTVSNLTIAGLPATAANFAGKPIEVIDATATTEPKGAGFVASIAGSGPQYVITLTTLLSGIGANDTVSIAV